jgi:hypothetical protein
MISMVIKTGGNLARTRKSTSISTSTDFSVASLITAGRPRGNLNWRRMTWPESSIWILSGWPQLVKGVEVAYKWSWIAEELDLAPISAGSCAGYASAGGADEEMLRLQEETGG